MARTHGKDADVAFDSVQIEDELSETTLTFEVPEADITSFSDACDPAAGQGDATIFGELGLEGEEWDFEPDGSTGYNGYAIVRSYAITSRVNDAIKYTASFRHNGGSAAADGAAPTRA